MVDTKYQGESVATVIKVVRKALGEKTFQLGGAIPSVTRLPTGLFELDLALGGGIPKGRLTVLWGPPGSNKTNVSVRAMKSHLLIEPDKKVVFMDLEGTFDPDWVARFGMSPDDIIVTRPDYGEQAVDILDALLYADDIGMIVVDSITDLFSIREIENSAERTQVAGSSMLISKMVAKVIAAMTKNEKEDRRPTLIFINQMRTIVGGNTHGSTEKMNGGNALNHALSMWIRFHGKPVVDPKVHDSKPAVRETTFIIKKNKFDILSQNGKFDMVMIPHNGLRVGEADDWNTVSNYLQEFGALTKFDKGQGWTMLGEDFKTLIECKARYRGDPTYAQEIRTNIIARCLLEARKKQDADYKDAQS